MIYGLGAVFALPRVKHDRLTNDIKHLLKRSESQPIGEKVAVQCFATPKDFAARLIEASVVRVCVEVGQKSLINTLTSSLIETMLLLKTLKPLALTVQARVQTCFDVVLQPEFHTIESVMSQLSVLLITGGISGERHISLISAHNIWKGWSHLIWRFSWRSWMKRKVVLIQSPDHFFSNPNGYPLARSGPIILAIG